MVSGLNCFGIVSKIGGKSPPTSLLRNMSRLSRRSTADHLRHPLSSKTYNEDLEIMCFMAPSTYGNAYL
jgi:hypothetical protein